MNETEECSVDSNVGLDHSFEDAFQFYTYSVLIITIGIFGIVGNVISMIILSRPQMRSSINYLLIGLARCDTVLILTSIFLFGLNNIYPYTGRFKYFYYYINPLCSSYVYPLACTAHTVSVYLTLTVTIERFVAVCHPLRVKSLCTYGRARWYVVGITIFALIYNIPRFFEVKITKGYDYEDGVNSTIYCVGSSEFRTELYIKIYTHWMSVIIMHAIPFTTLAILNTCIYKQVRRANAERQRLSRIQKREIGLATMLLVVVLVFFACNFLVFVNNVLETLNCTKNLSILVAVSNLLVTINSSINFVIYVIFGEKFKRLFLKIFCSHRLFRSGRESPDGTHDDSYASIGDHRYSIRLNRHGTTQSKNGSLHSNGFDRKSFRRAASPGPVVYYPQKTRPTRTYTTMTHLNAPSEWSDNGDLTTF